MQIQKEIEKVLVKEFNPHYFNVLNESDQHAGPPGRESHFHITLVSDSFKDLSRIKRHQAIYSLLSEWMNQPIHALSLHLFTLKEWEKRGETSNASPECAGAKS